MRSLLLALMLVASPLAAAELTITVDGETLLGAAFGGTDKDVVAQLEEVLGKPTEDSGVINGCELNGVRERFVSWGSLTAHFEEEDGAMVFRRWMYEIDPESGEALEGGPPPEAIILPEGIRIGDPFDRAARALGIEARIDEVFGIAMHMGERFSLLTDSERLDAPITMIGVPSVALCE